MAAISQDALRLYVVQTRERLQQLLQRLHWTEEGVRKQHRPLQKEQLQPAAPTSEQLPPSCMDCPSHSVQLTAALQEQLLGKLPTITTPNTFDELQAGYSASEKLLLYEHVVRSTPRQPVCFEENANFAELVATTKREHKKQRRYRKSKLTLQEEMHQLVELQMQALHKQWRDRQPKRLIVPTSESRYEPRRQEQRAPRRRSRSRSRSVSPSRSHSHRRKEHRSHKKSHKRSRSRSRSRHRHKERHKKRSRSRSRSSRRHKRFHRN